MPRVNSRYRDRLDAGMLAYIEQAPIETDELVVDAPTLRRRYHDNWMAKRFPRPGGISSIDLSVAGEAGEIPVRAYRPERAPFGTVLYLHGGGWVVGDLETHDDICSELAAANDVVVVAVNYRLAPEHPYPAAFDDCWAVLQHLRAHAGEFAAERVVVAGDSAGGNLAAALAFKVRDSGAAPLQGQVLIYPGLAADQTLPSYTECADAPLLSRAEMQFYTQAYCGPTPSTEVYAAPLLADDYANLAPAYVVVAEFDPIRDDGVVYAERLREAGVAAQIRVAEGLAHSFLRVRHTSRAGAIEFTAISDAIAAFL